jgi:hypothetical protein
MQRLGVMLKTFLSNKMSLVEKTTTKQRGWESSQRPRQIC